MIKELIEKFLTSPRLTEARIPDSSVQAVFPVEFFTHGWVFHSTGQHRWALNLTPVGQANRPTTRGFSPVYFL